VDINFNDLIQLQTLDEKIKEISLFLEKIPVRIEKIDQKIKTSFESIALSKEKLVLNQKKRRDLEADVQDAKAQIAKYRHQLNGVKTNKEYSALLKEINESEEKIEKLEEQILEEMLSADEIENEIKRAEEKATQDKEKFSVSKEEIVQEEKEKENGIRSLEAEKEGIIPQIPKDQVKLYRSIFSKNNGIALSPVTDDFCSMCQIRIRPQVLNELIAQKTIILCENCGRILYWVSNS